MEDLKVSKGVWKVTVKDDNCPWGVVEVGYKRFIRSEGMSFDEAKANITLVSAAKELDNALIECLHMIETLIESGVISKGTVAENRAREALSKARGVVE